MNWCPCIFHAVNISTLYCEFSLYEHCKIDFKYSCLCWKCCIWAGLQVSAGLICTSILRVMLFNVLVQMFKTTKEITFRNQAHSVSEYSCLLCSLWPHWVFNHCRYFSALQVGLFLIWYFMYILLAILLYLHLSMMLNAGLKWSIFFPSFTTGPFAKNAAFVFLLCLGLSFIYYSECFPLFSSHFHPPVCSALLQI